MEGSYCGRSVLYRRVDGRVRAPGHPSRGRCNREDSGDGAETVDRRAVPGRVCWRRAVPGNVVIAESLSSGSTYVVPDLSLIMELEVRLFATFREAVGRKDLRREFEGETVRAGEVLQSLEAEYPGLDVLDEEGTVHGFVRVLKNGREIAHGDGLDTELADGDTLSLFPPVAGG